MTDVVLMIMSIPLISESGGSKLIQRLSIASHPTAHRATCGTKSARRAVRDDGQDGGNRMSRLPGRCFWAGVDAKR